MNIAFELNAPWTIFRSRSLFEASIKCLFAAIESIMNSLIRTVK